MRTNKLRRRYNFYFVSGQQEVTASAPQWMQPAQSMS